MRQLTIQVPFGHGKTVVALAKACDGQNISFSTAEGIEHKIETVSMLLPNRNVGDLLAKLEKQLPQADVALPPSPVLRMSLPTDKIPDSMQEMQARSPIEVFLEGVQSIGSWASFVTYAAAAGVIVWIGLYTNSVFLLVASMLIAPFGGPAMNVAIASARGDLNLLKKSVLRYFVALLVVVAVTYFLSVVIGQSIATDQMVSVSEVSATAALLPIAGGVAGATQLVQSERSSLVSGTAIGMLVAAALAPPAGLIGMAIAIGMPEMVVSGVFLLLLQLTGINLSCATVFRLYGVRAKGALYERGRQRIFPMALAFSMLALVVLLSWQFSTTPSLLRSSRTQMAVTVIQEVVNQDAYVSLVESDVRFTRANIGRQNTLLSTVYVQPKDGQDVSAETVDRRLTQAIQKELKNRGFNVTPLVNVTLLEPPE